MIKRNQREVEVQLIVFKLTFSAAGGGRGGVRGRNKEDE